MRLRLSWLPCLFLLASPALQAQEHAWTGVERVVAVGDVHGGFSRFVLLLRQVGLIDEELRWTGGAAHLVQTGDVVDKGPFSRRVIDLLRDLGEQAREAGGRVHFLIGNHEAMRLLGDLRYAHRGEFAEFRTPDAARVREELFREHLREIEKAEGAAGAARIGAAEREKWLADHPLDRFQFHLAMAPSGEYGKWISGQNAIIRINDLVFVHGGISPKFAGLTLEEINRSIRRDLRESRKQDSMAMDPLGPLWYRGLARGAGKRVGDHLDAFLGANGAKRVVIGHTDSRGGVALGLGGRVLMIDIEDPAAGGPLGCLVVEKGVFYEFLNGVKRKL